MLLGWISSRPLYHSYLEKVKLPAVVCVHEQTLALCRAEFEGERRVCAGVPLRETGIGRLGAMQV